MHVLRTVCRTWFLAAALPLTLAIPAAAEAAPIQTLFVQSAADARLAPLGDDRYRLTLAPPDRVVSTFSDRPARIAGHETVRAFVDAWSGRGFDEDPPNAALVVDRGPRRADTMIVELTRPRLRGGRLTYVAQRIDPPASDTFRQHARRADDALPERLGEVHLFIDDASTQIERMLVLTLPGTGGVSLVLDNPAGVTVGSGFGDVTWNVNGFGLLTPRSVRLNALAAPANGNPAGVSFGVLTSDTTLTGTAYFRDGATSAELKVGDTGTPITISEGAFSIPLG